MEFKKRVPSPPSKIDAFLAELKQALQSDPGEVYEVTLSDEDKELLDPGHRSLDFCCSVIQSQFGDSYIATVGDTDCILVKLSVTSR